MDMTGFASDLPYPSLSALRPSLCDLSIISADYAGLTSELTAITQYVYHQLRMKKEGLTPVGQTLLSIAMVEMRHLNLLGTAILQLGGDPIFYDQRPCTCAPWSGSWVDYCGDVPAMLRSDLRLEQATIQAYLKQAKQVSQPVLAELLERIVVDERLHVAKLEGLLGV